MISIPCVLLCKDYRRWHFFQAEFVGGGGGASGRVDARLAHLLLPSPYCSYGLKGVHTMIKRLSKSRRSAILEHLLDLEKQIRAEFGNDNPEGNSTRTSETEPVRKRSSALQGGGADERRIISNEFTARSVH
jgi:hypothetical protein